MSSESPAEVDTKFVDGEKILCFHGPLIYEAKIQKLEIKDGQAKYFIHYMGWNKNWDEWVPEARMLKYTEHNIERKRDLSKAHNANAAKRAAAAKRKAELQPQTEEGSSTATQTDGKNPKVARIEVESIPLNNLVTTTTVTNVVSLTTSALSRMKSSGEIEISKPETRRSAATSTSTSATEISTPEVSSTSSSKKSSTKDDSNSAAEEFRPPDATVESEDQYATKVEVRIKIPDELKPYLVDDWDYLTRQRKLVSLPARLTVDQILNNYVKSKTATKSSTSKAANREGAVTEVSAGLKEYFNVMVGSQLLYKFEREQHAEILKSNPEMPLCKIYGAVHLLRLFVRLGGMLTYTPLDEKSIQLLLFYIHDFLHYMKKNASVLFTLQDYGTATPEYHRRSL